jgi:CBS domain-containing protein
LPEVVASAVVRDVMTRAVVTVRAAMPVQEAIELLVRHRITGMPVLDDTGRLVGVVSESDFIGKRGQAVGEVMSRTVHSVAPKEALGVVAERLLQHGIRRLPVVEGGQLVGVVTRRDLLAFLARSAWVCERCGLEAHALQAPPTCTGCQGDRFTLRLAPST